MKGARIDEVRNTPVITLMEAADLPAGPDPRLALIKGSWPGSWAWASALLIAAIRQAFGGVFGAVPAPPPRVGAGAQALGATAAEPDEL